MASKLEPVTFFEAHNAFKQLNGAHTRKKSTRLEIVTEILNLCNVDVLPEPIDDSKKADWNRKKDKICTAYGKIIANSRKRNSPGDSIFFDPKEDQIFAQYRKQKAEKDVDFDCSNLNLNENEIGAPRKICKIGKTQQENRLFKERSQKLRDLIVSFCDKEKLKVGPVTAKCASMILHDTTNMKHYDLESGKIFHKIAHGENVSEGAELDVDDGVYLMQSWEIGRDRMIDTKQYLATKNVHIPCTALITKRRKMIVPEPEDCFDQGKFELQFLNCSR